MKASHKIDALINGINKYMWKSGEKAAGQMDSQWDMSKPHQSDAFYLCTVLQWLKKITSKSVGLFVWNFWSGPVSNRLGRS